MKHIGLLLLAVVVWSQLSTINSDESSESEASLKAVVRGVNTFSKELYQQVKSKPGNLVVSPFSVSAVLAMLLLGLRGDTESKISRAIHTSDRLQAAQGFKSLLQSLQNNENVTLEVANKIYIKKEYAIKEEYLKETEEYFQSVAEEADIANKPREVERNVNQWASDKTHGKIQDILPEGTLTPLSVLILLNAIYFKGLWKNSFKKEDTKDEMFHLTPSSDVEVPMMHAFEDFLYADVPEHNLQMLSLPYQGEKHSMLILLPNSNDGLEQLESNFDKLDPADLMTKMEYRKVVLTLPSFKILSNFDLNGPLAKLGFIDLFSGSGNFSGISDDRLKVSNVIQKAFVEVNEEGTEAAAVTALVVEQIESIDFPPPPPPIIFTADHPFMYMIMDQERGAMLFLGRVSNPRD